MKHNFNLLEKVQITQKHDKSKFKNNFRIIELIREKESREKYKNVPSKEVRQKNKFNTAQNSHQRH